MLGPLDSPAAMLARTDPTMSSSHAWIGVLIVGYIWRTVSTIPRRPFPWPSALSNNPYAVLSSIRIAPFPAIVLIAHCVRVPLMNEGWDVGTKNGVVIGHGHHEPPVLEPPLSELVPSPGLDVAFTTHEAIAGATRQLGKVGVLLVPILPHQWEHCRPWRRHQTHGDRIGRHDHVCIQEEEHPTCGRPRRCITALASIEVSVDVNDGMFNYAGASPFTTAQILLEYPRHPLPERPVIRMKIRDDDLRIDAQLRERAVEASQAVGQQGQRLTGACGP